METKTIKTLNKITTQYSRFNTNQVLTEKQLNEFLDYFKDQDHLSRIGLSGVGIACGFKIDLLNTTVKITHGYGVTTDGDLLTLPKQEKNENILETDTPLFKNYTHYKIFTDEIVQYNKFFHNETQIDMVELRNSSEVELDTSWKPLSELENLNQKIALLYLENYQKEADLCTELNCDNQGLEQIANLKVLLVSVNDAKHIIALDAIYNKHNWYKTYLGLPEVKAKRIILTNSNTKTLQKIKQNYANAIKANNTLTSLKIGFKTIFLKFEKEIISTKIDALLNFFSTPSDFQYRYDIFKDLIDTYNEIKTLLLHINVECCPNIGAFPKHLLLGRLKETAVYKTARHQFYKSPIVGHEDANYKKVLLLLERAYQLVTNYKINADNIKITPSQINTDLANKAIPFYYDVNTKLLDVWSFEKTINLSQKLNLSYHTENLADIDSIKNPLLYNIDKNNFFRIEGHQGKMYKDALDQITTLKKENGLNFDVKILSINTSTESINIDDYKCEFEELAMLLKAWQTEQNCILAEMSRFFSGFSTIEAGTNVIAVNSGYEVRANLIDDLTLSTISISDLKRDKLKGSKKEHLIKSRSNKNFTYTKNIVEEELTIQDNTLGQYLAIAISDNKNGSTNDIMASLEKQVRPIIESDLWIKEVELANFIFKDISETLVHSYILDNIVPTRIQEIDHLTLRTYKLTIDALCKKVKTLQARYQTRNIKNGSKEILGLLINQMSTVCCSGKKLEILLDEIEKRKKEILTQIQLSEFVKKHPGLEHKAGVESGGTFVMAYLAENHIDQTTYETVTMELDFLKQPNNGTSDNEGILKLWNERVSTRFVFLHRVTNSTQNPKNEIVIIGKTIEETVVNFVNFLNNIWRRAGVAHNCKAIADGRKLILHLINTKIPKDNYFIQFHNPEIVGVKTEIFFSENTINQGNITTRNTVIADFSLPYMCCSDCTPINFIIQNEPIVTTLDIEDSICITTNTEIAIRVAFTNLNPKDGLIEIVGDVTGLTIENEELIIDPTGFTAFDQEITFTVNGLATDAKIKIHKKPAISVIASIPIYDVNIAVVTYTVLGDDLENITFTWDFEGNGITTVEIPDGNEFIRLYNLPIGDTNTISPIVTVSTEFCSDEIALDTIEFENQIEVTLDIEPNTCLNLTISETRIPFTYSGPDAREITFVNDPVAGLSIDNATRELVINSTTFSLFGQEIVFTVNGLVNATINIYKIPTAGFTAQVTETQLILSNISDNATQYNWNVNGELILRTNRAQIRRSINIYNSNVINVSLMASNDCGENVFEESVIIRKESTCLETTLQVINGDDIKLDPNLDVTTTIRDTILIPTKDAYKEVISQANDYLNGINNGNLESLLITLLRRTVRAMVVNIENRFIFNILSDFYRAQIRLFYNILYCQPNELLLENQDLLNIINQEIKNGFEILRESQITFDSRNELKEYLTNYISEIEAAYLVAFIKNELIPLI
ncbi:MAG: hypothetical protein L3J23_06275 [Flavobacteriaceae bacterium]|nr:hypothetical protein [Flavobacteriaceae bacterium]